MQLLSTRARLATCCPELRTLVICRPRIAPPEGVGEHDGRPVGQVLEPAQHDLKTGPASNAAQDFQLEAIIWEKRVLRDARRGQYHNVPWMAEDGSSSSSTGSSSISIRGAHVKPNVPALTTYLSSMLVTGCGESLMLYSTKITSTSGVMCSCTHATLQQPHGGTLVHT